MKWNIKNVKIHKFKNLQHDKHLLNSELPQNNANILLRIELRGSYHNESVYLTNK